MRFIRYFTLLSCLFASSFVGTSKNVLAVSAAEEKEKILTTNPFEDLIEDEQFKTDYLNGVYKYKEGDVEFLNFAEYKYQNQYTESFGLYVYFYNPDNGRKIDLMSDDNKIELSIDDSHYYKYKLIPISRSTDDIQDLFYKFRVETDQAFHDSLDSSNRTYYLSSFELKIKGESEIHDISIGEDEGMTLSFTGYAKGCNGNDESTLECHKEGLETIHLKTYGGTKRSGFVNEDLTKCIDLNYVYFEIPNRYIDNYGDPYAVSFEFYDCYTDKGIYNIRNHDYYIPDKWYQCSDDYYKEPVIKRDTWWGGEITFVDPYRYQNGNTMDWDHILEALFRMPLNYYADTIKNNDFYNHTPSFVGYKYMDEYVDVSDYFTPTKLGERLFRENEANSEIKSSEIKEKIEKYGIDYFCSSKNIKYSGVIEKTIDDIEDPATPSVHQNLSAWSGLINGIMAGDSNPYGRTQVSGETWDSVPSFEMITQPDDNNGDVWEINKEDVENFNRIYESTTDNDTSLFILRFNESEYWTAPIYFERENGIFSTLITPIEFTNIGYTSFMHIIDKFDIISLTFKMNDKYKVIPVVSDPIKIVPGATPPVDDRPVESGWWDEFTKSMDKLNIKLIIGIIAGVVLVFLLIKLIIKISQLSSQRKANKANEITIKEAKKRRKDKEKHGEKE